MSVPASKQNVKALEWKFLMHRCTLRWEETLSVLTPPRRDGHPWDPVKGARNFRFPFGSHALGPRLPRENQGKVNHRATSLGSSYRPASPTHLRTPFSFVRPVISRHLNI